MIAFVLRDQNEEANELAQGASGYKSLDVDIQLEEYPLVGCLVLNVEN